jgi:hypothetical protein
LQFAKLIVPGLSKTKTYVTGGLKTVEGMVKALDTVDGVGLGRALCQEPNLCALILSGQVKGAMLQKLNMLDFGATAGAAGLQISQMGKGLQPVDLSIEENVAKVFSTFGAWAAAKKENLEMYEFPVLPDYNIPYATAVL